MSWIPGHISRMPRVSVAHDATLVMADGSEHSVVITDVSSGGFPPEHREHHSHRVACLPEGGALRRLSGANPLGAWHRGRRRVSRTGRAADRLRPGLSPDKHRGTDLRHRIELGGKPRRQPHATVRRGGSGVVAGVERGPVLVQPGRMNGIGAFSYFFE